jgi:23S rRNA G2445 N2-methylase RlmL
MKAEIKTRRQATWGPPLGLLTMLRKIKKRRGFVTTSKGGLWKCVVTENRQHAPLTWREPAKTSKLLLAGNAATHPQTLRKLLFCNRNFLHIKTRKLKYLNDLSKSVSNQNLNDIITER